MLRSILSSLRPPPAALAAALAASATGAATLLSSPASQESAAGLQTPSRPGGPDAPTDHLPPTQAGGKWPVFSRKDVARHDRSETGIWVTFGKGVYDVTEFVESHPGGASKIKLAAGKAVEPFWGVYQQHQGNKAVEELLGEMKVGELSEAEAAQLRAELEAQKGSGPGSGQPAAHPALTVRVGMPVNAEVPASLLMDGWVTPNDIWYIRHHHPVPVEEIKAACGHSADDGEEGSKVGDASKYELELKLQTGEGLTRAVTVHELKTRFKKSVVTATMQCGGNRRGGLDKVTKSNGTGWDVGAISNARWGGVYLAEILNEVGISTPEDAQRLGVKHVQFESLDSMKASIPIEKVLNAYGDVLVAYEMNGEDIPLHHGYPLRAIVPGVVGVRNVKWLKSITLSGEESEGPWQRGYNYKMFSPSVKDLKGVDISKVPTIQEQPVQSAIVSPGNGDMLEVMPEESLTVKGYSYSGGGRGIIRVDVSIDNGKSWHTAELKEGRNQNPMRAWAWTFWEAEVPVPNPIPKNIQICCKATDYAHNCQPESPGPIWNLRGLNNNAWHRVNVNLSDCSV